MIEIAIEGIDGSGKSCLAQKLASQLEKQGLKTSWIDVPHFKKGTSSPLGRQLFKSGWDLASRHPNPLLITGLGLVAAIYYLFCRRRIIKANCDCLVTERHPAVNAPAYGQFYAGWLGKLGGELVQRLWPKPDKILVLELNPQTAYQRICQRGLPKQKHETLPGLTALSQQLRLSIQKLERSSIKIVKLEAADSPAASQASFGVYSADIQEETSYFQPNLLVLNKVIG